MKQSGIGATVGSIVLALVIAVAFALARREPPKPIAMPAPPASQAPDAELTAALDEFEKRLDEQEKRTGRLEAPGLAEKDRLAAADAALDGMNQSTDAMNRLLEVMKARVNAGGGTATQVTAVKPRVEELTRRWDQLNERIDAAVKGPGRKE
ncbi:MAG TPA: hypothetical protein VM597_31145 [Gemmataceae bacterium]|jgi:hypothetical protein|nr:hypothetical protein [Gemmataceae bacterium]